MDHLEESHRTQFPQFTIREQRVCGHAAGKRLDEDQNSGFFSPRKNDPFPWYYCNRIQQNKDSPIVESITMPSLQSLLNVSAGLYAVFDSVGLGQSWGLFFFVPKQVLRWHWCCSGDNLRTHCTITIHPEEEISLLLFYPKVRPVKYHRVGSTPS